MFDENGLIQYNQQFNSLILIQIRLEKNFLDHVRQIKPTLYIMTHTTLKFNKS